MEGEELSKKTSVEPDALVTAEERAQARFATEYPRAKNFWLVTHNAHAAPPTRKYLWTSDNRGPNGLLVIFKPLRHALQELLQQDESPPLSSDSSHPDSRDKKAQEITSRLSFTQCDFRGTWDPEQASTFITFKDCTFEKCCFNFSSWRHIKFQNCTFVECDFSLAEFEDCIFTPNCRFDRVSVSSDHLRFKNTSIKASALLSAAATNTLTIQDDETYVAYQQMRLAGTKYRVASNILSSTHDTDPEEYFDAYQCFVLFHKRKKIARCRYMWKYRLAGEHKPAVELKDRTKSLSFFRKSWAYLLFRVYQLELAITWVSGILNNWGESLLRPAAFAVCLWLLFALVYHFGFSLSSEQSLFRSLDILLIAGYSKYTLSPERAMLEWLDWTMLLNLVLGVYWYSIFVPTVIRQTIRS